jgi:hypothetical protein
MQESIEMWVEYVELCKKYKLFVMDYALIDKEVKSLKVIFCGEDKERHPCLIMRTRLNNPQDSSEDSIVMFMQHMLD